MSVMDETIEDCVGIGGVADKAMPVGNGYLTCDDGRAAAITVFEDFKEVVTPLGSQRLKSPIVKNQELHGPEAFCPSGEGAVAVGQSKIVEELRCTDIENGTVVPAGLVSDGAPQPTFPHPGCPLIIKFS
jgi:hypothetical protein